MRLVLVYVGTFFFFKQKTAYEMLRSLVGSEMCIRDRNFSGLIEEIEPERGKLKVTVNIFGRNTPVELEYWHVEKG